MGGRLAAVLDEGVAGMAGGEAELVVVAEVEVVDGEDEGA